ncbi:hypothetical protein [Anaerosporobacter faecicola]|uniref:hypothetical protein n=1 Tax=Anaerosporobacter faecicola TaxID=2718714 RepID=UPI00143B07D9|nr:hypothetical protein [Anaerosporobacter faecicola]
MHALCFLYQYHCFLSKYFFKVIVYSFINFFSFFGKFGVSGKASGYTFSDEVISVEQKFVVVEELNKELVGFICVQLKKSFCYEEYMVEITEAY